MRPSRAQLDGLRVIRAPENALRARIRPTFAPNRAGLADLTSLSVVVVEEAGTGAFFEPVAGTVDGEGDRMVQRPSSGMGPRQYRYCSRMAKFSCSNVRFGL